MSAIPTDGPSAESADSNMFFTYVGVLVVEAIVIAGLYWLGRYFG